MTKPIKEPTGDVEALRAAMDAAEDDFVNAKIAFQSGAEYRDVAIGYDELRLYAERFIAANYAFQRGRWGRVRIKLSPSNLMRE
jgi:hypothetical protein